MESDNQLYTKLPVFSLVFLTSVQDSHFFLSRASLTFPVFLLFSSTSFPSPKKHKFNVFVTSNYVIKSSYNLFENNWNITITQIFPNDLHFFLNIQLLLKMLDIWNIFLIFWYNQLTGFKFQTALPTLTQIYWTLSLPPTNEDVLS